MTPAQPQKEKAIKLTPRLVLMAALSNAPGWRLKARLLLGLTEDVQCPVCLRWFDKGRSGSGKTCGRKSCQYHYRRERRMKELA